MEGASLKSGDLPGFGFPEQGSRVFVLLPTSLLGMDMGTS